MTILITGASSGIGLAFAEICAREGHALILVARRRDRLESLKKRLQDTYKSEIDLIELDLSCDDSAENLMRELNGRRIDGLINNAGSGDVGLFAESNLERVEKMLHLNILTLTALTRRLLPQLIQQPSGFILNVASIAAFIPGPTMATYFASKAYVLSFSEALANELSGTGVSVTVLCPGATQSEFDTSAGTDWGDSYKQHLPTAEEVAEFGYSAMKERRLYAIHGLKNSALVFLVRFLPRKVVTRLVRKML
jgi:short-subunit dehydrogenase